MSPDVRTEKNFPGTPPTTDPRPRPGMQENPIPWGDLFGPPTPIFVVRALKAPAGQRPFSNATYTNNPPSGVRSGGTGGRGGGCFRNSGISKNPAIPKIISRESPETWWFRDLAFTSISFASNYLICLYLAIGWLVFCSRLRRGRGGHYSRPIPNDVIFGRKASPAPPANYIIP